MFDWLRKLLKGKKQPKENHAPIKLVRGLPHESSCVVVRDFVKEVKTSAIREANIQRRKDTLGYGLKGKFRPRPAHEKKLWRLDKKPEED